MKAGRLDEASAIFGPEYSKSIRNDPSAISLYARFWLKEAKTNQDSALEALETMARISPLEMWDRRQLAYLFIDVGKPARAEDVYGAAYLKTLGPEVEPLTRYASFWKSVNRNLFSALDAARRACQAAPDNASAWGMLADVCVVTANPKEGLAAVEKVLQLTKSQKDREKYETMKKQIQAALEKKDK
jgi:tetratricopeptide (TPR) repeat protein